jgi:hypothetical protein
MCLELGTTFKLVALDLKPVLMLYHRCSSLMPEPEPFVPGTCPLLLLNLLPAKVGYNSLLTGESRAWLNRTVTFDSDYGLIAP